MGSLTTVMSLTLEVQRYWEGTGITGLGVVPAQRYTVTGNQEKRYPTLCLLERLGTSRYMSLEGAISVAIMLAEELAKGKKKREDTL